MNNGKKVFDVMTNEMLTMGLVYGLGTPESRAIVTAIEHARIIAAPLVGETIIVTLQ